MLRFSNGSLLNEVLRDLDLFLVSNHSGVFLYDITGPFCHDLDDAYCSEWSKSLETPHAPCIRPAMGPADALLVFNPNNASCRLDSMHVLGSSHKRRHLCLQKRCQSGVRPRAHKAWWTQLAKVGRSQEELRPRARASSRVFLIFV